MYKGFVPLREIWRSHDRPLTPHEAGMGIEPMYRAFAELRLTTWLPGLISCISFLTYLFVDVFYKIFP